MLGLKHKNTDRLPAGAKRPLFSRKIKTFSSKQLYLSSKQLYSCGKRSFLLEDILLFARNMLHSPRKQLLLGHQHLYL